MEIKTKEELAYIMKFYGIKQVPVYEGRKRLGIITHDMKYEKGHWFYKKGYEYLAYKEAIRKLNEDIEKIKKRVDYSKRIWHTHLIYSSNNTESIAKSWSWQSDIRESGVTASTETGSLVLSGTIDQMRLFIERANHHYIYCNGTRLYLSNDELRDAMELFSEYGLYAPYDSFSEYVAMCPIVD